MTEADNQTEIVDIEELNEIMDSDTELIQECFDEFIKDWPIFYVEVKGAILEKNADNLDAAAHKLKGTLRYLAAKPAATAALNLETAGKENNFQDVETKLENLKNECMKVVEYINNFNI